MYTSDNLKLMRRLADGCCDLIYLDPPFFSGRRRRSVRSDAGFDDSWAGGRKAYLAFMAPRLEACRRLLAAYGTLYVHLDWRISHVVRVELDRLFGSDNFLNEIIWHYRTGGASKRWFGRKHDTILVYARKAGRHRFHVQRGGTFRTDGLKRDSHGRSYKSTSKGRLYFHPDGPILTDVWDMPFLSTVSRERVGWPTQKPVTLLERIIRASSVPGDLVADFFCGSGTTLVAARRLGRRWLGCDVSAEAIGLARRRLAAVRRVT
ncbi:MAG: DNA-methyltransferase [Phycisphaerae bacterium]